MRRLLRFVVAAAIAVPGLSQNAAAPARGSEAQAMATGSETDSIRVERSGRSRAWVASYKSGGGHHHHHHDRH